MPAALLPSLLSPRLRWRRILASSLGKRLSPGPVNMRPGTQAGPWYAPATTPSTTLGPAFSELSPILPPKGKMDIDRREHTANLLATIPQDTSNSKQTSKYATLSNSGLVYPAESSKAHKLAKKET